MKTGLQSYLFAVKVISLLVTAFCIVSLALYASQAKEFPEFPSILSSIYETDGITFTVPSIPESYATLLAPEVVQPKVPGPDISKKIRENYRLVTLSLSDDPARSMAFIENMQTGFQRGYIRGDQLDEVGSVAEVRDDGAVIMTDSGPCLITFGNSETLASYHRPFVGSSGAGDVDALLHKFGGTRQSTNEWSFSRSVIMDYYNELLSRPERLEKVFDSLAPVYNGKKIEGYTVDIQGEADFFKAIGFNQGDIVRSVNYIPMTNRRAAENLIQRFARDAKMDFIVIKLEREGQETQQNYRIGK